MPPGPLQLTGLVTKVGFMNKTATVTVSRWATHAKTMKRIERSKKYLTHDPENQLRMEDRVVIINCPPVSARKRFALHKILKSPEAERDAKHAREAAAVAEARNPGVAATGMKS
ncbi:nucleic acid-binding protein [Schizopora paradoxa]|uniref:Nucleic acid-binding protein n=1 Tax=Schizopora paradoxa TaxID=27342 RepID=A0A0H2S1H1_9AGAM|nr:nucleic acid-binding protein [Schizopora paradoxa]